jgi:ketosteroid isomerase-like protein
VKRLASWVASAPGVALTGGNEKGDIHLFRDRARSVASNYSTEKMNVPFFIPFSFLVKSKASTKLGANDMTRLRILALMACVLLITALLPVRMPAQTRMSVPPDALVAQRSTEPGLLAAQQPRPAEADEAIHNELRALRDAVLDAFNKRDMDRLLTHVHPNAVLTWQDGTVSRGHQGIRDYYNQMMLGEKRVVDSVDAKAEVDELTILYGPEHGVAFGSVDEDFRLTSGMDFHLPNRWTADLVKENGRWQIASLHVSANVFDNPVQRLVIGRVMWWTGGIAAVVGLLVGVIAAIVIGRLRKRQP